MMGAKVTEQRLCLSVVIVMAVGIHFFSVVVE